MANCEWCGGRLDRNGTCERFGAACEDDVELEISVEDLEELHGDEDLDPAEELAKAEAEYEEAFIAHLENGIDSDELDDWIGSEVNAPQVRHE